jgi:hypothetical protein
MMPPGDPSHPPPPQRPQIRVLSWTDSYGQRGHFVTTEGSVQRPRAGEESGLREQPSVPTGKVPNPIPDVSAVTVPLRGREATSPGLPTAWSGPVSLPVAGDSGINAMTALAIAIPTNTRTTRINETRRTGGPVCASLGAPRSGSYCSTADQQDGYGDEQRRQGEQPAPLDPLVRPEVADRLEAGPVGVAVFDETLRRGERSVTGKTRDDTCSWARRPMGLVIVVGMVVPSGWWLSGGLSERLGVPIRFTEQGSARRG